MPNPAKKSIPDDQNTKPDPTDEQLPAKQAEPDDFEMDDMEEMAALLIDALTIPPPATSQTPDESETPAADDEDDSTPSGSPRQLQ